MAVIKIHDFNNYKITDSAIIKRILSGEKELYEMLIRRNNQKLYRVIKGYVNEEDEIEDVMQNTYLKAYEKLYQYKHIATFSTWLIRIAINESLTIINSKNKIFSINKQVKTFDNNNIIEIADTNQLNPEKKNIIKEAKQLLKNSIDNLEPKYKTAYILKEIEEMSIKEIAECLDISSSNVKIRIFRAKNILKDKLFELANNKDLYKFGFKRCDRITEYVIKNIL